MSGGSDQLKAFIAACQASNLETLKELVGSGLNINAWLNTYVHVHSIGLQYGNLDFVKYLVENGIDLIGTEFCRKYYYSYLSYAAKNRVDVEVFPYLWDLLHDKLPEITGEQIKLRVLIGWAAESRNEKAVQILLPLLDDYHLNEAAYDFLIHFPEYYSNIGGRVNVDIPLKRFCNQTLRNTLNAMSKRNDMAKRALDLV